MSTLAVTSIQADLQWEDKPANLRRLEEKIDGIGVYTEVVILPEMFSTGFSMRPEAFAEQMNGPTINWMRSVAARKKIILTGSLIIEEDGDYFNRLIWMLPTGQYGCYDKRHRFAYAGEDDHYTAGQKRLIASVKGWKVLLLVCYDLRFPVWSRQQAVLSGQQSVRGRQQPPGVQSLPAETPSNTSSTESHASGSHSSGTHSSESHASISNYGEIAPISPEHPQPDPGHPQSPLEYDLLICVANWPERRSHAWKTLLQARAIENQSYVVGVNRVGTDGNKIAHSGDSMIVDPLGETLYHAGPKEETFTFTLKKQELETVRQRFPFWRDADHFYIEP